MDSPLSTLSILVTGASGLVGTALRRHLRASGNTVIELRRDASGTGASWAPEEGRIDLQGINRLDAVIHLAGESIASGRWTRKKKARIRESRVAGTKFLCTALKEANLLPKVFIAASAIGYYGNRGDELLTESSVRGVGFLSEVAEEWEHASDSLKQSGVRVVHLRFGIILSRDGGAFKQMLPPFSMGLGGRIGEGSQWMSWIGIEDVLRVIEFTLLNRVEGQFNVTAPHPVQNHTFTQELGLILNKPTPLPLPAFLVKLLFGEMGEALLLSSARVIPTRLLDAGFTFKHPDIRSALKAVLS